MAHIRQSRKKWLACWREPSGKQRSKSCGPGSAGKRLAEQLCRKVEAELLLGVYKEKAKKRTWTELVERYAVHLEPLRNRSQQTALQSLAAFTRIAKPGFIDQITIGTIEEFTRDRRRERGRRPGSKVSPATVNRELAAIQAALNFAVRRKWIESVPEFRFLPEPKKEPTYINVDEFSLLYSNADAANQPCFANITSGEWWRAFMIFQYMTGWRLRQVLNLEWGHVDFRSSSVVSPAEVEGNKSNRDKRISMHKIVVDHLRQIHQIFSPFVFPWELSMPSLYAQIDKIANAAGVEFQHGKKFHDFRRGFATINAPHLDILELQSAMQHQDLRTTLKYVSMAERSKGIADKLQVPALKKTS